MARQSAPARAAILSRPQRPQQLLPQPPSRPPGLWWRAWVLILLAACVTGIVPVAVSGNELGVWSVSLPGAPNLAAPAPAPTPAPDLALPRQAWIATQASVVAQPGSAQPIALLEPGFPVTLVAHATARGASWSQIQWAGPTKTTGGSGWVPDADVVSFGAGGRSIGDLGALSPGLAQAAGGSGDAFSVALYFPDTGQLYHLRGDQSIALGNGLRAVLLAALYANAEKHHGPLPATTAGSPGAKVAQGDTLSAQAAYAQIGGAQGISSYLTSLGVTSIQPVPTGWTGAQATTSGLLAFYVALDGGALTSADTAALKSMLMSADPLGPTAILGGRPLGKGGVLVVGTAQTSAGWTVSASGIVAPAGQPRYIIALAIRNQPSLDAARQALAAFYAHLAALFPPT
jgi:hypothetical protein